MKEFLVTVLPELSLLGSTRALSGKLDEASFAVGGQEYTLPEGIGYDVRFSNTGEALLLSGSVSARVQTQCARCLEPAEIELEGSAEGYYLLEHVDEVEGMEPDEYGFVAADGTVDLAEPLLAGLVHELPFAIYCREDCQGLCPHCGANLNDGPCTCDDDYVDPTNPFAALKDFKFDDE